MVAEPFSGAYPTDGVDDQVEELVRRFGRLIGMQTGDVG